MYVICIPTKYNLDYDFGVDAISYIYYNQIVTFYSFIRMVYELKIFCLITVWLKFNRNVILLRIVLFGI